MIERLFAVLNKDGTALHGGTGKWHSPKDGNAGEWMPPITGELIPYENGYHLYCEQHLVAWLGPHLYEAEYRGECLEDCGNKIVVREARLLRKIMAWNERTARLFACDCAEHVLDFFEAQHPDDHSPRHAIETARQSALGKTTVQRVDAAWVFDWRDAAEAASCAAYAAYWEKDAASAAKDAANVAARAPAEAATSEDAWDAWVTERKWQTARLMQYLYDGIGDTNSELSAS